MGVHYGVRSSGNGFYLPPIVTNSLVLYVDAANIYSYPGTGTTWTDLTGNGNNGTLLNGASFLIENGGVINFDGSNDYVSFPSFNYDFSNGFTYFGFVKIDSTKSWARFMDFGLGQDNTNIIVYQNSTTQKLGIHSQIGAQSSNQWGQLNSNGAILAPSATYRSIAGVIAAGTPGTQASSAALYYNGVVTASTVQTRVPFVPSTTNRTSNFFGRSNWPDAYYDGTIGISLIYNRALSANEILENHNALRLRYGI